MRELTNDQWRRRAIREVAARLDLTPEEAARIAPHQPEWPDLGPVARAEQDGADGFDILGRAFGEVA